MSAPKQLFSISRADEAVFKTGLRTFISSGVQPARSITELCPMISGPPPNRPPGFDRTRALVTPSHRATPICSLAGLTAETRLLLVNRTLTVPLAET